jgi:hypothetical protein
MNFLQHKSSYFSREQSLLAESIYTSFSFRLFLDVLQDISKRSL